MQETINSFLAAFPEMYPADGRFSEVALAAECAKFLRTLHLLEASADEPEEARKLTLQLKRTLQKMETEKNDHCIFLVDDLETALGLGEYPSTDV